MNNRQRVAYYLTLLKEARTPEIAKAKILADLNSLVSERTKRPFTEQEKRRILDELDDLYFSEQIIRKSVPGTEHYGSINESDNSGILDVISALKRGERK